MLCYGMVCYIIYSITFLKVWGSEDFCYILLRFVTWWGCWALISHIIDTCLSNSYYWYMFLIYVNPRFWVLPLFTMIISNPSFLSVDLGKMCLLNHTWIILKRQTTVKMLFLFSGLKLCFYPQISNRVCWAIIITSANIVLGLQKSVVSHYPRKNVL